MVPEPWLRSRALAFMCFLSQKPGAEPKRLTDSPKGKRKYFILKIIFQNGEIIIVSQKKSIVTRV